ncbi:hypothetical protein PybrP1_011771 [[Pythium] brassicae (nom. inval.)]|nr:hypothetical protein PybrP1_011771 [[Pythium] brassicae (nom. inval.)]
MAAIERDAAVLTLASVNLHIGSLIPSTSPHDAAKRALLASRPPERERRASSLSHEASWAAMQLKDRLQWLQGFKTNQKGGLVYLDLEALRKQQGVVKEVMLQVGSQLLAGKLAVRISLPIRIFEPRTLLERLADGWNYAPTLLKKAALSADPLERMKFVIAFVAGGFHFCTSQLKPFNPILGETYQATYADGARVFIEHVSHHPVKSAFTLSGPKGLYELSGVYEFESATSRNSIVNHQIGSTKIVFQDGHTISYTVPQIKMTGILFGERVVELTGAGKFVDAAHHLIGEVNFGANSSFLSKSRGEDIKGCIYPAKKSAKHALSALQGSWLTHLEFDNKIYWHVESEPVFEHTPVADPLPSDSRFREDVIALKNGDAALAQSEKLRLEELQRDDGKLRGSQA